jgi:sterol desaturase/sphingolipid hydroxylase (fatty acid hydroxylase superfamily)
MRVLLIRALTYPLIVFGGGAAVLAGLAAECGPLVLPAVLLLAVVMVSMLERLQPYALEWNTPQRDLVTDSTHAVVNLGLTQLSLTAYGGLAPWLTVWPLWPNGWPLALQVLLAALLIDAAITLVHRASHVSPWLWRFHQVHHHNPRLYLLTGERRHPLHHLLESALGTTPVMLLGAPPRVIAGFAAIYTLVLLLEHANIDYRLGPLRWLLVGAETHRFHHGRATERSQVNFGGLFAIWDHLLGSFADPQRRLGSVDIGLEDPGAAPDGYLAQLRWPFAGAAGRAAVETIEI